MKFIKANGLVIHYLDQGRRDGPPLVFINSLGTDFRIWNEVAEILGSNFWLATRTAPRPSLWFRKRPRSSPARALRSLKALGHLPNVEKPEIVAKLLVEHAGQAVA